MKRHWHLIWLALGALLSTPTFAEEATLRSALKEKAFKDAKLAMQQADTVSASLLTPETYQDASDLYARANKAFNDGADVDRVRKILLEATSGFEQAATMAPTVETFVSRAYQARRDALEAEADKRSPKLWAEAEDQFYSATSRAEKGRESRVGRYADKAEKIYREAELLAIENVLFTEIDEQIDQARKLDADRWAPRSYTAATELITQARSVLAQNRYDTDEPRNLAKQAQHNALHAQYVAKLADDIDDNDTTLENVLLDWEDTLSVFGERFDVPMHFDDGPEEPVEKIDAAIQKRAERLTKLEQESATLRQRLQLLQEELLSVQAELENRTAAKNRFDKRLMQQEEREESLARVDRLFSKSEAEVVRAENRLIIRLVGLGFASGSAEIETRHEQLLDKLIRAMGQFPQTPITIEGHTDSYGVDTANLELSVRRAEAVAAYVLENTAISSAQVSAVGFGETKPIANNETADGRWKNRRIDVVIYPSWFSS